MKKLLKSIRDLITMPFISAAILIHESREVNKEEILENIKGEGQDGQEGKIHKLLHQH